MSIKCEPRTESECFQGLTVANKKLGNEIAHNLEVCLALLGLTQCGNASNIKFYLFPQDLIFAR